MNRFLPLKKHSSRRNTLLLALAAISTALSTTSAQTLSWDGSQTGTGPSVGSNTWDAGTTVDWYPGTGTGDTVWTNGDNAIFAGTGTPGTVTIGTGGVTAGNITFNTAGYTIAGAGLTIKAGSTIALNAGTETIGAAITSTVTTSDSLGVALTTSGTGTLVLTARPAVTGIMNLTGGSTLQLGTNTTTSVANIGNAINLSGGSTLIYNDNIEETETTVIHGTGNVTYTGFSGGYLNVNGFATNTGVTTVNLANGSTNHTYDDALYLGSASGLSRFATLNMLSGNLIMRANDTVAGLTGTGGFVTEDSGGVLRLTTNVAAGQTYTYSGVIGQSTITGSSGTNNNSAFAVAGAGTQILSGNNTYTGGTYIEGGVLELTGTLAAGSSFHSDGINGIFDLNGSTATGAKAQSLGGMAFAAGEGTVQETLGTASSVFLTLSAPSTRTAGAVGNFTTVGGVNGTTVGTTITGQAAGFIDQGTFFNLGKAGGTYANYDTSGTVGYMRGFNYASDTGGSVVAGGATLGTTTAASHVETTGAIMAQTTATVGTLQLAGATGANTLAIGSGQTLTTSGVLLTGTGTGDAAGAITGGTITGGSSELVLAASQAADKLTVSSVVTGTGAGVTQGGAGAVILTGANTYTGLTSVAGGTLQIGNGTAGSLVAGYAGGFNVGGNLVFDLPATSTTFTGAVTGMGNVVQNANTVILTGANTYTGTTTVGAGATLQFGTNTTTGTINANNAGITVGAGGNVVFNDNVAENVGGPVTGAGNVVFLGQQAGYYSIGNSNTAASTQFASQTGLVNNLGITGTTTVNLTPGGASSFEGTLFAQGPNALSATSVLNVISGNVDLRASQTVLGPDERRYARPPGPPNTGGFIGQDIGTDTLTVAPAAGQSYTYGGVIGQIATNGNFGNAAVGLTMAGTGTQTLSGTANNYTGATTVNSGTLIVSGALTGGTAVTVNGGMLEVTGSIASSVVTVTGGTFVAVPTNTTTTGLAGASVTISGGTFRGNSAVNAEPVVGLLTATGGVVSPGGVAAGPGRLEVAGNASFTNSTLALTLNGTTIGTGYSQLVTDAALTLNSAVNLQLSLGYTPVTGTRFIIADAFTYGSGITGTFSSVNGTTTNLAQDSTFTVNGVTFEISYTGTIGSFETTPTGGPADIELLVTAAVPEPSTSGMMAVASLGLLLFVGVRRFRVRMKTRVV